MQETTNLKLKKPDYSDVADIADINANMDILDEKVHKNEENISNINSNKADKTHNHNNGADLKNVDASKLGGKSASDFAACSVISDGDFNKVSTAGLYTMRYCANSPDEGNYYGLLVVKSDTGNFIEQMAFKEHTYKVYVRYCSGGTWSDWEEIGSKCAEKLRIFDVDGITLKDTNGVNDVASITPKQVTENEARLTGFNTSKYWFNFGIPNQTLKVPYADMAIRALSFGKGAIPADTGMVRNVEGISEAVMNDPLFPVGYITRTHTSPYSPVNNREFHIMYFPSTKAYGTQIAIEEQSFDGKADSYDDSSNSGKGFAVYIRSGQNRFEPSEDDLGEFRELGYTVTADPSNDSHYIASDWSDWVKVNTTSQIYQQAFTVINVTTKRSLTFSEKDLDAVIKDIYQRILGITSYTHPTTSGYNHIPSGGSSGQILKWSSDGSAKWGSESTYTHPTTAGYKHIPTGGQDNQVLAYSASGTAQWANNGVTYTRYTGSLTASTEYYIAKTSHSGFSFHNNSGGTARIRVTARDGSSRFQIMIFDVYFMNHFTTGNVSGVSDVYTTSQFGESRVELVGNYYKGVPLFKEYMFKPLNEAKFTLKANTTTSSCVIEVTVESSLYTGDTNGAPSLLADVGLYDTTEVHNNGDSGSLIYNNDFAKTHYYTSSSVTAGSTSLRNGDVIMKYV